MSERMQGWFIWGIGVVAGFIAGIFVCLAVPAHAAPVTFAFTGTINSAPISGSYTFDSTAPFNDYGDQSDGHVAMVPVGNSYAWGLTEILTGVHSFNTAAQSLTSATIHWNNQQGTINLAPVLVYDPMYFSSSITAEGDLYGATVHVQGLTGYDYFGLTLENLGPWERLTHLPALPPSLNGLPAPLARLELYNMNTGAFALGTVTSLTAVPLPASVWLMGFGLLALVGVSARNWRRG
jgi:hypothetical protein